MQIMPDMVLVEPEKMKESLLIQEPGESRKGKIALVNIIHEQVALRESDRVLFGDDFDKFEIRVNGIDKEFYLMHYTNIKISFGE